MFSNFSWISFIVGVLFGTFGLPFAMSLFSRGSSAPAKRTA